MLQVYSKYGIKVEVSDFGDVAITVEDGAQVTQPGVLEIVIKPNLPILAWVSPKDEREQKFAHHALSAVTAAHPGCDLRESGGVGQDARVAVHGPTEQKASVERLALLILGALKTVEVP